MVAIVAMIVLEEPYTLAPAPEAELEDPEDPEELEPEEDLDEDPELEPEPELESEPEAV